MTGQECVFHLEVLENSNMSNLIEILASLNRDSELDVAHNCRLKYAIYHAGVSYVKIFSPTLVDIHRLIQALLERLSEENILKCQESLKFLNYQVALLPYIPYTEMVIKLK